jgi:uroporphyrinogen decarboxylase
MEDMLMDFVEAPRKAHAILERITQVNLVMIRNLTAAGADIIHLGDDVGTQHGMMMSPAVWREFLKPRLAREFEAAKEMNPDVMTFYHSDGRITDIIPDLIEIGLDILNPVQPECVDPVEMKQTYGDKLAFWGTIGTQTTMPFGTPDDVRDTVKAMVDKVGYDGGLVLAPTHVLEPEVPWANIDAFVEACREYGRIGAAV